MRETVTYESVEDRISGMDGTGPERHRELASELLEIGQSLRPDDEVSRGFLLVEAGQQLALAGDHEAALSAYRAAVETGDTVRPDARCYVFSALLRLGHRDDAEQLNRELRRSRPSEPDVFLFMGEHCEEAGLLDEANRWFTQGVLRYGGEDGQSWIGRLLISSRWRVRRAIGFTPDEYDELALAWLASAGGMSGASFDDEDGLEELHDWDDELDEGDDGLADWDDELDELDDQVLRQAAPVARKAPCPCGSGRKYKHCCGRLTSADSSG